MVRLSGRIVPNRSIRTKIKVQHFVVSNWRRLQAASSCADDSKLPDPPLQPNSTSEMAESFTNVVFYAVEEEIPPPPRRTHKRHGCETAETSAVFTVDAREDARRFMRVNHRDRTAWKTLRTVLSGSVRCSVETWCYGSTDVLSDARKNN